MSSFFSHTCSAACPTSLIVGIDGDEGRWLAEAASLSEHSRMFLETDTEMHFRGEGADPLRGLMAGVAPVVFYVCPLAFAELRLLLLCFLP